MSESYPPSDPAPANFRSRFSLWQPFSNGITSLTITVPQSSTSEKPKELEEITASRWNSSEFYFYYFVFALAIPYMAKVVIDLSKGSTFLRIGIFCGERLDGGSCVESE